MDLQPAEVMKFLNGCEQKDHTSPKENDEETHEELEIFLAKMREVFGFRDSGEHIEFA